MSLDIGDRRIGVALSDKMQIIANPFCTYERTTIERDLAYFASVCFAQDVTVIVSGLPISMNGNENAQTIKTREFASQLSAKTGLEVKFIDERLTTVSAERVLIEGNVSRDKRKGVIDKVAATIILQSYLDYYKK
ncbi:MAG: Holliday junction resolvase RuvX [Clostridia bacterium]